MTGFDILPALTKRAKVSRFWLGVLNFLINRVIPFNRSHRFKVEQLSETAVRTVAPYRRSNHNHIRGIHACALATVAEFSAGFLLMQNFAPSNYRLIMSKMEVEYKYQAKKRVVSESILSLERREKEILRPLETASSVDIVIKSNVVDILGNEVAVAHTTWQIKRWNEVRTAV